jgi:hypothetical protein
MMRSVSLLCGMIVGVSVAFAQVPSPTPLSPFEQELVSNEKQFIEACQTKNAAYVSQSVSNGFQGIGSNGDFYDKSELVGEAREGLPKDFRIYEVRVVRLDDSSAIVTYNEIVPGSHPRYRHMSDTWAKDGGRWQLKFRQMTPNLWSALDLD